MLNEGVIVTDVKTSIKSEMVKQLQLQQRVTPESWERAVFKGLTGFSRNDVDWDVEDNHAGYFTWIKSFDALIVELVEDGYVHEEVLDGQSYLVPTEPDMAGDWSSVSAASFAVGV